MFKFVIIYCKPSMYSLQISKYTTEDISIKKAPHYCEALKLTIYFTLERVLIIFNNSISYFSAKLNYIRIVNVLSETFKSH